MAWEPITDWINGQIITAVRLMAIHNNIEYNRARSDIREVDYPVEVAGLLDSTPDITIEIDGTDLETASSQGVGTHSIIDMDVSGYAEGLHTVSVNAGFTPGGHRRWYKHADMDYLSVWFTVESYADYESGETRYRVVNVLFISHRESKSGIWS